MSLCAFCLWKTGQGLSLSMFYHWHSPREFIFTCKLLYQSSNRERAECGHCLCCCTGNNVKIGVKTYGIGHVIGTDAFHLDAPTMHIYRSLTIKSGRSCLPSLIFLWYSWRKCKVGKNAILGLLRAEMVRNTCFQSNIVSVTYVSTTPVGTINHQAQNHFLLFEWKEIQQKMNEFHSRRDVFQQEALFFVWWCCRA